MKKIGLHAPVLDDRGNGTVTYDYASGARNILGMDPVIISSKQKSIGIKERFSDFDVCLYEDPKDLSKIIEDKKVEFLYMTCAGADEGYTPKNCKTGIHCVFNMEHPFGDVYAGVSEWLAKFFKKDKWVPHIINMPKTNETLHDELGIPKDAFIVGRLGGYKQFDVPSARLGLVNAIEKRSDLWAIFLNTEPFANHPRIKFLPFSLMLSYKSKFINTCDAMLHGRSDGETFGLAVGEFSSFNKPIFTYDADYWWYMRAHLDMLGDKALKYKNDEELTSYLLQIDKDYIKDVDWDCYSVRFSPSNVMKQFNEVFIL